MKILVYNDGRATRYVKQDVLDVFFINPKTDSITIAAFAAILLFSLPAGSLAIIGWRLAFTALYAIWCSVNTGEADSLNQVQSKIEDIEALWIFKERAEPKLASDTPAWESEFGCKKEISTFPTAAISTSLVHIFQFSKRDALHKGQRLYRSADNYLTMRNFYRNSILVLSLFCLLTGPLITFILHDKFGGWIDWSIISIILTFIGTIAAALLIQKTVFGSNQQSGKKCFSWPL